MIRSVTTVYDFFLNIQNITYNLTVKKYLFYWHFQFNILCHYTQQQKNQNIFSVFFSGIFRSYGVHINNYLICFFNLRQKYANYIALIKDFVGWTWFLLEFSSLSNTCEFKFALKSRQIPPKEQNLRVNTMLKWSEQRSSKS